MKLASLLLLVPVVSAQLTVYSKVAASIDSQVKSLNVLVKAYTGGDVVPILKQASSLITAQNDGRTSISRASPLLNFADGVTVYVYFRTLATDYTSLASALLSKSNVFSRKRVCGPVSSLVTRESRAATNLFSVLLSQYQSNARPATAIITASVVSPVTTALATVISSYSFCAAFE